MDNTPNLALPYILPSQAQKHVTHNEALRVLDAAVQLAVLDRDRTEPPPDPAEGDRHIVAASATGAWAGQDGRIAAWQDASWSFLAPRPGWLCFTLAESRLLHFTDEAWEAVIAVPPALQNLARLGLGTTADGENPFAAKLNKALWAALATSEGGSGDLRYTLNKQAPANVLSLLMQSNWSGRAEIGLAGSDDLSIKVSANGADWSEALVIDRQSGKVALPRSNFLSDFAVSLYPDSGRFAGNASKTTTAGAFAWPAHLTVYNGTTAEDAGKFITNNDDYGGSSGALPAEIKDLVDRIRDPSARRYGVEFRVARLTMGSGRALSTITVGGVIHYLSLHTDGRPRAPSMTFHAYLRSLDAPIAYRRYPGQTILKDGVTFTTHVAITPEEGWVSLTVLDEQSPRATFGYTPGPLNVACADTGHRWLIACPALMGGITAVDDDIGVIVGVNTWLP